MFQLLRNENEMTLPLGVPIVPIQVRLSVNSRRPKYEIHKWWSYFDLIPKDQHKELSMSNQKCLICGYEYNPEDGDPANDVKPGTAWDDVPEDWICPVWGAGKDEFEAVWPAQVNVLSTPSSLTGGRGFYDYENVSCPIIKKIFISVSIKLK